MYFQTADIEVALWVPPLVAFVISFFTSMGGVSGAFLLLPFQVSYLGYTHPSVSATNQLFNIVAIPSGVYRYWREGRMIWPLTVVVIVGTLPGVFLGALVRVLYLPDPRHFKIFAALVLLYIGLRLVRDLTSRAQPGASSRAEAEHTFQKLVQQHRREQAAAGAHTIAPAVTLDYFTLRRLGYTFYGKSFDVSLPGIFSLSLIVGIIGGIYGIGGGAIIAPFFVTFYKLPVYTVAGAALMGTFVTSIAGVIFYQAIAPFYPELSVAPDWLLGLLFGLGGMVGMYCGARCQKFMPATAIKAMLAVIILGTAGSYLIDALSLLSS